MRDRDAKPEVYSFEYGGDAVTSLSWATPDGSTSASPASRFASGGDRPESSDQARERVLSALELPGQILDYHFAIQGLSELLYKRRRTEPQHLPLAESLAWLDVRIVEAHPLLFRLSPDKEDCIGILAFNFLVELYEREGYLHEALAAAERFARFRPGVDAVTDLRARVARLQAEHA